MWTDFLCFGLVKCYFTKQKGFLISITYPLSTEKMEKKNIDLIGNFKKAYKLCRIIGSNRFLIFNRSSELITWVTFWQFRKKTYFSTFPCNSIAFKHIHSDKKKVRFCTRNILNTSFFDFFMSFACVGFLVTFDQISVV